MLRRLAGGLGILVVVLAGLSSDPAGAAGESPLEKRGCCSHHHGVCGCSGQVAMCCDGSPSPTCGC
jgi:hypothetical protein